MKEIKISVVSYLNSSPFIYGLKNSAFTFPVNISLDIPSVCADKVMSGKADIGLVPVAILPLLKQYRIISDFCIGADGPVKSVLLLSDVPLKEIKTILLDYQSRTSVALTKILSKQLWNISPEWKDTTNDYEKTICGTTAGVIIGDRAMVQQNRFKFVYDLSEEWTKLTGLPFMFACWVTTIELTQEFEKEFSSALKKGINEIETVINMEAGKKFPEPLIRDYFFNCISYNRDERKNKAPQLFLTYL